MIDFGKLAQLGSARVLVVGDVMLDRYYMGDTQRISPEAPVPIVKINRIEDKAGGAANVARNIAHLDAKVGLLGLIGEDAAGDTLSRILAHDGIHAVLLRQSDMPTIAKMRVISRHQQVVRLDMEERFSEAHSSALGDQLERMLSDYDVLLISDYDKGSLSCVARMIDMARTQGKKVLVDPKQLDLKVYCGADIITPNLAEFRAAGGQTHSDQAMVDSAREILGRCGIGAMLLTRSEHGMSLITPTMHQHVAAQVQEVSDVTGAGDTVIATLAVMLGAGMELHEAVQLANLAAGIVVGKLGAATVSPEELAVRLNTHLLSQGDVYQTPYAKVLQHIQFARQNGERIVFTNGCFDILHAGHVRYLAQARALGDRLVVGLNSDASVSRLKGPARPINPLAERATVLSSLSSVDWVLPFGDDPAESDTPLALIRKVRPDVLAKGGDYSVEGIVGATEVLGWGGEVRVLPFVDGCSTTAIVRKLQA